MSCCKKGTHEWLNIPSLDPVIIDSMSDSECWIFIYSNIFKYFQQNIFISNYIQSFSVSRIYLDIRSYNVLLPEYIWIFIRTIFSHPNIFEYSFRLLWASQIYLDIHLCPKNYSAFVAPDTILPLTPSLNPIPHVSGSEVPSLTSNPYTSRMGLGWSSIN